MLADGGSVKPSLRKVLADSLVSDFAVVILLLFSLRMLFQALLTPLPRVASFLLMSTVAHGLPYISFTLADRAILTTMFADLFYAFVYFAAAWLLSRWVHGIGPFRCLTNSRAVWKRRYRA